MNASQINQNVTVEFAVEKLVAGLQAIPDDFSQVGCASANPQVRAKHAAEMIRWGREFANTIESLSANDAIVEITRYGTKLANLDPRGWYLGNWAHVAKMISAGRVYTLVGGVLCAT